MSSSEFGGESRVRADGRITLVSEEAVSEYGNAYYYQYVFPEERGGGSGVRTFCVLDIEDIDDVIEDAEAELLELAAWCVFLKNQKLTGRGKNP